MPDRDSQVGTIVTLLRTRGTVSVHDLGYKFGITRAAARIAELRAKGWEIETIDGRHLETGDREMASYRLIREPGYNPRATYVQETAFGDPELVR